MTTLAELSQVIRAELRGSPEVEITGVASLDKAGPSELAPADSERFREVAASSSAGALLVPTGIADLFDGPRLLSEYPMSDLNHIIELFGLAPAPTPPGIHPTATINPGADVGKGLHAGPYCSVEAGAQIGARCVLRANVWVGDGVVLGDDCVIEPGAVLYAGCEVGDRVRIGANAVVSRQGFGYAAGPEGPVLMHHIGKVVIEDDVDLGAGTMVDRARFDETRIGRFSKLDNLVQVAHNCSVGQRSFVAAQTGLAGGGRIGDDCEIGGQVGIGNHAGVGDRCRVGGKSGFFKMFGDDKTVLGYPAHERTEWLRQQAQLRRLAGKK